MRHSAAGKALAAALAPMGMFEADPAEFTQIHDLALSLISPDVAGIGHLRAIREHTGYGVYVVRGEGAVTGFLAFCFLNQAGLAATLTDAFAPRAPQLEYLVGTDEEPAGVYCWGIAANRPRAAATLVSGSWAARGTLPELPYFVRAATDAGRRLLTRNMNFVPYPGSKSGLLWWPTFEAGRRAA